MKNVYDENYKSLLKETAEDLNKGQTDLEVQSRPSQNPGSLFCRNWQFYSKIHIQMQVAFEKPKQL